MNGFAILVGKELREAWRTRRLPVIGGLFAIVGMVSPLTARYLPEILKATLGDQLTIPIPTPTVEMALEQLQKNLGQLGALATIALAMGSVAGELDHGTAALVLSQPVTRRAFLAAKLVAIGLVLAISTAFAVAVAWIYTAVLFEPGPIGGWLVLAVLAWLGLAAWGSITFLASAATGSTTAAAGLGFVGLIGLSIAAAVPAFDRFLPSGLTLPAIQIAAGTPGAPDAWRLATAIGGTLVIIVASAVGAVVAFRRREL